MNKKNYERWRKQKQQQNKFRGKFFIIKIGSKFLVDT